MTFTTPLERPARARTQPEAPAHEENSSAHEIKYRQDAARYVASMLTELRQIAGKAGLDKLVTAVDAAYYEAYAAQKAQNGQAKPTGGHGREKFSESMEQTHG